MTETQKTIHEWATGTFGPSTALDRLVRCNVEAAELLSAVHVGADWTLVQDELADVQIIFMQVKEGLNFSCPSNDWDFIPVSSTQLAFELCHELSRLGAQLGSGLGLDQVWEQIHVVQDVIHHLAHNLRADLDKAVDDKMVINRARGWAKLPSGRYQHT